MRVGTDPRETLCAKVRYVRIAMAYIVVRMLSSHSADIRPLPAEFNAVRIQTYERSPGSLSASVRTTATLWWAGRSRCRDLQYSK